MNVSSTLTGFLYIGFHSTAKELFQRYGIEPPRDQERKSQFQTRNKKSSYSFWISRDSDRAIDNGSFFSKNFVCENAAAPIKTHDMITLISKDGELSKQQPLQKIMRFWTAPAKFHRPQKCNDCGQHIENLSEHLLFKCSKNRPQVQRFFSSLRDTPRSCYQDNPIKFMRSEMKHSEFLKKFLHLIAKLDF